MKTLRLLIIALAVMFVGHSCSADEPENLYVPSTVQPDPGYLAGGDGVLSVLAIGNSFSQDAVEQDLIYMMRDASVDVHLANARIGGCSLEQHVNCALKDKDAYAYWQVGSDGESTVVKSQHLDSILRSAPWDIVTIQQVSQLSGMYDTFEPYAPYLITYIRERCPADVHILWHQTWAYSADSDHGGFANYGYDQEAMYQAIVEASARAVDVFGLDGMIPSGRAVQMAREQYPDIDFTRDGYHLNSAHGRYLVSAVWYEALTGADARDLGYYPASRLDGEFARALREVAHNAVNEK